MNKKGSQRKLGRRRHTARTALRTAYYLMPDKFQRHLIINEAMMYSHFEYSESYLERELRQMRQDGEINYVYASGFKKFIKVMVDEKTKKFVKILETFQKQFVYCKENGICNQIEEGHTYHCFKFDNQCSSKTCFHFRNNEKTTV